MTFVEHALSAFDPRPQPLLEILVLLALVDMRADGGSDDLGHWLIVYGGHCLKFVGLVSGQPDCHGFSRFHCSIMPYWWLESKWLGGVVSWWHKRSRGRAYA